MTDDPTFPLLHGRPRQGWINDPNGLCRVDGRFHTFFQLNPDAPVHTAIAWGHASSSDLLHWTDEPVALRPRPGEVDAHGCWSGCVVVADGTPTAVYTAVREHPTDAWATLATGSPDLREWAQGNGVAPGPEDPEIGEVRDPFVLTFEGHRYVVQGAGRAAQDGRPQLLAYQADDLTSWELLGPLLTADDPIAAKVADANIWECPNLFRLGEQWVLLVSLWRANASNEGVLSGVRYLVGDLAVVDGSLCFAPTSGGVLDDGPCFYAPQVLVEPDRVLLWGWAWELDRSDEQVAAAGWAGSLTFPRELVIRDGELVGVPAPELTGLRQGSIDAAVEITVGAFELIADGPIGLTLQTDDGNVLVVDPAFFADGPARILVDGSVVEAYGSSQTFTTRAYPTAALVWSATGVTEAYRLGL